MIWIYFSPHLDDAVLSCGGVIWEQTQAGDEVQIWTIAAGDPPRGALSPLAQSLHQRWEMQHESVNKRRLEDYDAIARLSAIPRHFSIPDCIYRRSMEGDEPLYPTLSSIYESLHLQDYQLIEDLSQDIAQSMPPACQVVAPLGLGKHVDHLITRNALECIGNSFWYYADYPYILQHNDELLHLKQEGWKSVVFPVSKRGLEAWVEAVAAYTSQISTFWRDLAEMRSSIYDYYAREKGIRYWKKSKMNKRSNLAIQEYLC